MVEQQPSKLATAASPPCHVFATVVCPTSMPSLRRPRPSPAFSDRHAADADSSKSFPPGCGAHVRLGPSLLARIVQPLPQQKRRHLLALAAQVSPVRALLARIPLGPRPWLNQLRRGSLRIVRRLPSYYGEV